MKIILPAILFFWNLLSVPAQDQSGFRGPGRTGIFQETGLLKKWPDNGPSLALKISGFGKGYSQPVVSNGIIYLTGTKDSTDYLSAYDLNGTLKWQTAYGHFWIRTFPENRCTPTVSGNSVYVSSGTGEICRIDATTGSIIWKVDASVKYNGEIHKHGNAESLLLTDDAVVYTTGGSVNSAVALRQTDGSLLWKSESLGGSKSYASPVLMDYAGFRTVLLQTAGHLLCVDAGNGKLLWNYNLIQYHKGDQGVGAQTNPPLVSGNEIFVTSGYNHPALMFSVSPDGKSVSLKWRNDTLDCHLGGVVCIDGVIYGSDWLSNSRGNWAAIDWKTGNTFWERSWKNKGPLIAADGMLYLMDEKGGNIALAEPDRRDLKIVSTFRVTEGEGPFWAHPAIYNGMLYIRHGDVLMVYNIKS